MAVLAAPVITSAAAGLHQELSTETLETKGSKPYAKDTASTFEVQSLEKQALSVHQGDCGNRNVEDGADQPGDVFKLGVNLSIQNAKIPEDFKAFRVI
ncbi:MAG: hypothetical protein FRX49_03282 [Trebouxia sp. A1-2]|nr:MAG: hypothetical protein FRX49_03282 [Trebouxia sp. A1-2]